MLLHCSLNSSFAINLSIVDGKHLNVLIIGIFLCFSLNHIPIKDKIINVDVKDFVDATATSLPAFIYTPQSTFCAI